MHSISQVAEFTGVSTRTLQYYDEIGLLKPSGLTPSGYRLYDEDALQKLQQILFFKELGFKLKEIKEILEKPDFDRMKAFKKQKELLLLKLNRTSRLIQLLSRLEKGEPCMSFKEFDLSDYIQALESFKNSSTEDIIRHWGSMENFDLFIRKIKDDESEVAKLAIKQFGSVEKYTEAMKYNLEHFSEIMEKHQINNQDAIQKSDSLYSRLTSSGAMPSCILPPMYFHLFSFPLSQNLHSDKTVLPLYFSYRHSGLIHLFYPSQRKEAPFLFLSIVPMTSQRFPQYSHLTNR